MNSQTSHIFFYIAFSIYSLTFLALSFTTALCVGNKSTSIAFVPERFRKVKLKVHYWVPHNNILIAQYSSYWVQERTNFGPSYIRCKISSYKHAHRPTERRGGGAEDTSSQPPNWFWERGLTKLLNWFAFLCCIFRLFLFVSLSIALSGLNEWTLG